MAVGVGILMAMAAASCDTPMVATSTTTRGDLRSRRMIAMSTTAPKASPTSERDDEGHPERHVVLHDQEREEGGPDHAHVADGEVDDPGGAVDEHHPDGDHRDGEPLDDAVEDDLAVDPRDGEHHSIFLAPEEHRPRQVVPFHQVADLALEAHAPLLEEDGPVGDGGRHVQGLLDDDERHAGRLEPVDRPQ